MPYYVLMMFTISIAGTGIFLLVFWMEKRFKSYSIDFLLRLMEVVFIFFLIPAMALTACLFQNRRHRSSGNGERRFSVYVQLPARVEEPVFQMAG